MTDANKVISPYQKASNKLEAVYSKLFEIIKLPLIYQSQPYSEGCAQINSDMVWGYDTTDEPPVFLKDMGGYDIYLTFKEKRKKYRIEAHIDSRQSIISLGLFLQTENNVFGHFDSLDYFLREPRKLSDKDILHYLTIFDKGLERLWQSYYEKYYLSTAESFVLQANRRLFERDAATLKKISFDRKFPQRTLDSF